MTSSSITHEHTPTAEAAPSAVEQSVREAARAAKDAQPHLARLHRDSKDRVLLAMAEALVERTEEIVAANARDLEAADAAGIAPGLRDRLVLVPLRIIDLAALLHAAASHPGTVVAVHRVHGLQTSLHT